MRNLDAADAKQTCELQTQDQLLPATAQAVTLLSQAGAEAACSPAAA